MKNRYFLTSIFCLFVILLHADERVRLIIMADMGNEEDEMQQMAHMLACSNEFELELTLKNLKAMAYLALYSANKYRAATYLEQNDEDRALKAISIACGYWKNYTNSMDALFKGVTLQRNFDFSDWHAHDDYSLQDYINLGGELSK